jgi:hypothetical protein
MFQNKHTFCSTIKFKINYIKVKVFLKFFIFVIMVYSNMNYKIF